MFKAVSERLNRLLGKAPSCDRVHTRLIPYDLCDPSLTDAQYAAIHTHLAQCPGCCQEYAKIRESHEAIAEFVYPDEVLPEIDVEAMVRRIIATNKGDDTRRTKDSSTNAHWPITPKRKFATALALCALVLIVMPVLAHVGQEVWQAFSGSGDSDVASTDPSDSQLPSLLSDSQSATGSEASETAASPSTTNGALPASIDKKLQEAAARAYVESLPPHTEKEYEVWAREEHPQIMRLHDVLMGRTGTVPSERGASREDNALTITLPGASGNMVTLRLPLPDDSRTDQPLWDGIPTEIPDWAQRLYADTPESERPTGWRALLIHSGQIFKFDWPTTLEDPNAVADIEAIQAAAAIAGIPESNPTATDPWTASGQDMPAGYEKSLAADIPLAKSVILYIHVSALMVETPEFDDVSQSAGDLLAKLSSASTETCVEDLLATALPNLFSGWRTALLDSKEN